MRPVHFPADRCAFVSHLCQRWESAQSYRQVANDVSLHEVFDAVAWSGNPRHCRLSCC